MKTAKKPSRSHTVRRPPKDAPNSVYYLLDSKGELFDVHKSRSDAYHDAVGPRFYKGYFIVEYRRRGMRRYKYRATHREVTGRHD
jgi:hypothetical protein